MRLGALRSSAHSPPRRNALPQRRDQLLHLVQGHVLEADECLAPAVASGHVHRLVPGKLAAHSILVLPDASAVRLGQRLAGGGPALEHQRLAQILHRALGERPEFHRPIRVQHLDRCQARIVGVPIDTGRLLVGEQQAQRGDAVPRAPGCTELPGHGAVHDQGRARQGLDVLGEVLLRILVASVLRQPVPHHMVVESADAVLVAVSLGQEREHGGAHLLERHAADLVMDVVASAHRDGSPFHFNSRFPGDGPVGATATGQEPLHGARQPLAAVNSDT